MSKKPKAPAAKKHTEASIFPLLRTRYSEETGYALLPQVPDGTGTQKTRTADALAVQLWPSRGISISGFEIKVTKADWRKELADPAKADAIAQYCSYWWIVTPPGIVPPEELPPNWGLLEVRGDRLRTVKPAPLLEPQPVTTPFLAGVLRAAAKSEPVQAALDAAYQKGYETGHATAVNKRNETAKHEQNRMDRLEKAIADFEEASGIRITHWNGRRLGEAAHILSSGTLSHHRLEALHEQATRFIEGLTEFQNTLKPEEGQKGT